MATFRIYPVQNTALVDPAAFQEIVAILVSMLDLTQADQFVLLVPLIGVGVVHPVILARIAGKVSRSGAQRGRDRLRRGAEAQHLAASRRIGLALHLGSIVELPGVPVLVARGHGTGRGIDLAPADVEVDAILDQIVDDRPVGNHHRPFAVALVQHVDVLQLRYDGAEEVEVSADHLGFEIAGAQHLLEGIVAGAGDRPADLVAFGVALAVALHDDLVPATAAPELRARKQLFVEIDVALAFGSSGRILNTVAQVTICR